MNKKVAKECEYLLFQQILAQDCDISAKNPTALDKDRIANFWISPNYFATKNLKASLKNRSFKPSPWFFFSFGKSSNYHQNFLKLQVSFSISLLKNQNKQEQMDVFQAGVEPNSWVFLALHSGPKITPKLCKKS